MDIDKLCDYALYSQIKELPDTERKIAQIVVSRLAAGVKEYGPWDKREHNNGQDIFEEFVDAAVYAAAAIVEMGKMSG